MRFMIIVHATERSEAGVMPSTELIAEMGRFNEQLVDAGIMLDGDGLRASSHGVRVRFSGAERTVVHGPFPETEDLIAGYWIWQAGSLQEAIDRVEQCPNPDEGDSVIEIRQLFEVEDFGDAATPELREREERLRAGAAAREVARRGDGRNMRVMVLHKSDPATEETLMPDEEALTEMGAFNEELVEAGLMLAGEGLHPSRLGARVHFSGDRRTVVDGPFTEAKELIVGFWVWRVKSMEEAIAWTMRCPMPASADGAELEIRPFVTADDFGEAFTPELREREERLRARSAGKA